MPLAFINHGGGPLPLLGDPGHRSMVAALQRLAAELPQPRRILVVTAHWEADRPTVSGAAAPTLLYDYHGFPPESYRIRYPCPGDPELARAVCAALNQAGLDARIDTERGLDHGVFVPLKIMYPNADIPVVALSLLRSLDASAHLAIGRALRTLNAPDLLVLGSGLTFHNLRAFFDATREDAVARNAAFLEWLEQTCADPGLPQSEREARLARWTEAPFARFCHPREEHLLPLHVCVAAAGRAADEVSRFDLMGWPVAQFVWHQRRDTAQSN